MTKNKTLSYKYDTRNKSADSADSPIKITIENVHVPSKTSCNTWASFFFSILILGIYMLVDKHIDYFIAYPIVILITGLILDSRINVNALTKTVADTVYKTIKNKE